MSNKRRGGTKALDVKSQEVAHSVPTEESDVDRHWQSKEDRMGVHKNTPHGGGNVDG